MIPLDLAPTECLYLSGLIHLIGERPGWRRCSPFSQGASRLGLLLNFGQPFRIPTPMPEGVSKEGRDENKKQ
ncbi:hypothetical protein, partial [Komagataeibacter europaeus]|uniref:hypothetical protein n=1 Tax=Komagataeibacter europaeus TaxID=33995 RepID=UPI002231B6F1